MPIEKKLRFTLKSGSVCEHQPVTESEDKWWEFVAVVANSLRRGEGGVLIIQRPYGIHRTEDISAVHFDDVQVPPETPPIGFQVPS